MEFRLSILAARALFAGTIVAVVVAAAPIEPPDMTGIIATFPAVLLSTMVILTRSQGADFARATGRVLIVSSAKIVVYALVVTALFPRLRPWLGSVAAFAAAIVFVALFLPLARRIA